MAKLLQNSHAQDIDRHRGVGGATPNRVALVGTFNAGYILASVLET
jgi:hypothetical protein